MYALAAKVVCIEYYLGFYSYLLIAWVSPFCIITSSLEEKNPRPRYGLSWLPSTLLTFLSMSQLFPYYLNNIIDVRSNLFIWDCQFPANEKIYLFCNSMDNWQNIYIIMYIIFYSLYDICFELRYQILHEYIVCLHFQIYICNIYRKNLA